jgi:hypothetical protein
MFNKKVLVSAGLWTSSLVLAGLTSSAFAGWGNDYGWGFHPYRGTPAQAAATQASAAATPQQADVAPQDFANIAVVSAVPKLFFADCGPGGFTFINNGMNRVCNGKLSYVDPFLAAPVATPLVTGATLVVEGWNTSIGVKSGVVDPATSQVTGMKEAFVIYLKLGKLYKVDTTTLVSTAISNEAGATDAALCQVQKLNNNPAAPLNATIAYRLKGADNLCYTPDDLVRAVKLSMGPTAVPINLGARWPIGQLMDATGSYLVRTNTPTSATLSKCSATFATCTPVGSVPPPGNLWTQDMDFNRAVLSVNGGLAIYNYATSTVTNLYTPVAGESVTQARLDRDGFVYYQVARMIAPFTNTIRRVPVAGGISTVLATYTTTSPAMMGWIDLSSTRIGFAYPNATMSGVVYSVVPKAGGVATVLSNAMINGGMAGDWALIEDSAATVRTINLLTGLVTATRPNSTVSGMTFGGSVDWHYGVNPATFRFFLSSITNAVKSYAIGEDISLTTTGVAVGTLPANLYDMNIQQLGNDLIGTAIRPQGMGGNDVVFMRAATANSLKRLTNSATVKINTTGPR